MKLSGWKDIAEIVALAAVVGGVFAVVIELRQTQSALRSQAYQTRASGGLRRDAQSYSSLQHDDDVVSKSILPI